MPYLTQAARERVAAIGPRSAGDLNYALTRQVLAYLRATGVSYTSLNAAVGALECAKAELLRRVVAPYEDLKRRENGDVYESARST